MELGGATERFMRIAIGSDHAGYEDPPPHYKPTITEHLQSRGYEIIDCGTNGPDSVDYPDYADKVCEAVLDGSADLGGAHSAARASAFAWPRTATKAFAAHLWRRKTWRG